MRSVLLSLCFLSLILFSACDDELLFSSEGVYIRLQNDTDTPLTDLVFSFGFEESNEFVHRLRPGRASGYHRFDDADHCSGIFLEGNLASGETIAIGRANCAIPDPIAPGRYSFSIRQETFSNPDGSSSTFIRTEIVED